jgi:hypothetical protein
MTNEELIEALTTLKEQAQHYGDNTFVWSINIDSFNFVIDSTIKALEQEPTFSIIALLEKTYNDFCNCEGGEGWLKIDGKEYDTDAGYAIEGVDIFMEVFKRRLAESEEE